MWSILFFNNIPNEAGCYHHHHHHYHLNFKDEKWKCMNIFLEHAQNEIAKK